MSKKWAELGEVMGWGSELVHKDEQTWAAKAMALADAWVREAKLAALEEARVGCRYCPSFKETDPWCPYHQRLRERYKGE